MSKVREKHEKHEGENMRENEEHEENMRIETHWTPTKTKSHMKRSQCADGHSPETARARGVWRIHRCVLWSAFWRETERERERGWVCMLFVVVWVCVGVGLCLYVEILSVMELVLLYDSFCL